MTMTLEPKDKLDTVTMQEQTAVGESAVMVSGPKGEVPRLRERICTASQSGVLKRFRSLKQLMLRSRANTLECVRRVRVVDGSSGHR